MMGQGDRGRLNHPLTRTTLGHLSAASWVCWSRPAATQPGIKPGSVVMPQALQCSALDRCATRKSSQQQLLLYHSNYSLWIDMLSDLRSAR